MDLLEYQAKELFGEVGIPVLPSQRIDDPRSLKRLQIPYPVVLKSQVHAGGRGRVGGVRFVENTIDAIAAARSIFNLPILGEYLQVLLAEARYDAEQEFLLAVVLDYQRQCPVLLGSVQGGMGPEPVVEQLQSVVVDDDFSPFYARHLAIRMGLSGDRIQAISTAIEKMYQLLVDKDLNSVEINPLGIGPDGEVMALDGKVQANDSAIARHADLRSLAAPQQVRVAEASQTAADAAPAESELPPPRNLDWGDGARANIGAIANDWGLALATWDLLALHRGKLACCLLVGDRVPGNLPPETAAIRQLEQALVQLAATPQVEVILVNLTCGPAASEAAAEAIANLLQGPADAEASSEHCQYVIRLVGGDLGPFQERLAELPVHWMADGEEAIRQAASLAKSR